MVYAHFQKAAVDAAGNVLPNIWCEVRREGVTGSPLEPLFADRDGTTPLDNPFMAENGVPDFYCAGGAFRIRYYKAGHDETFRFVGIGLGSESDIQGLTPKGAWDTDATYEIGDLVSHEDGGDTYLFASRVNDNTGNEPDTSPASDEHWMYVPALQGPPGEAGSPGAPGAPGTTSYDWPFRYAGLPPAEAVLDAFVAGREITFAADFDGSYGFIGTNPTSTLVLTIKSGGTWDDDGTTVGTVSISTSGVFTFETDSNTEQVIPAGTLLKVIGPSALDATAANIAFTLVGNVP